jgi:hypothetical protein
MRFPPSLYTCLVRRPVAAKSARASGLCATQRELFEQHNIWVDPALQREELRLVYVEVCRRTG